MIGPPVPKLGQQPRRAPHFNMKLCRADNGIQISMDAKGWRDKVYLVAEAHASLGRYLTF